MLNKELVKQLNYGYLKNDIDLSFLKNRSLGTMVMRVFLKLMKYLIEDVKNLKFRHKFDHQVIFISRTLNNELAMTPVYESLPLPKKFYGHYTSQQGEKHYLPRFVPAILSLLYLPKAIGFYKSLSDQEKHRARYSDTDIFFTYGFYRYFTKVFKKQKPLAVVVSNSEYYITRILVHLSEKNDLPSFYINHACIYDQFPPISETKALIFGQDTREKYIKVGTDPSKLIEVGMPKSDKWFDQINNKEQVEVIGYAINGTEDITTVVAEVRQLVANFPNAKTILRPHPMQYHKNYYKQLKPVLEELKNESQVAISDPRSVSPFDFITEIDVLISGESSIHLEAVMLNVYAIYFDNTQKFIDHYGFLKQGLIPKTKNFEEVVTLIKSVEHARPYVRKKAKYYIATIDTPNDGKATPLAVKAIEDTIDSFKKPMK